MAQALAIDRKVKAETDLNSQYEAFKRNLIHDISVGDFADVYAETIAYGLFASRLHLMEGPAIGDTPFPFEGAGDGIVAKPKYEDGKVWINRDQYFNNVPEVAWDFPLAGYQPAQHWLKHRRSRELNWQDVRQYQCVLKVLVETERLMKQVDGNEE